MFLSCQVYSQMPGVAWMAETELTYLIEKEDKVFNEEKHSRHGLTDVYSTSTLMKIDIVNTPSSPENYLENVLIGNILSGDLDLYSVDKEKALGIDQLARVLTSVDTIITFDPNTYEEKIKIVRHDKPIHSLIFEQTWWIDEEDEVLRNSVNGFYPVIEKNGQAQKACWVPFNRKEHTKEAEINDPDIVWMKLTTDQIALTEFKVIEEYGKDGLKKYWDASIDGIPAYEPAGYIFKANKCRENYVSRIVQPGMDTIVTFDPETFEEKYTYKKYDGVDFESVKGLEVHQVWYYDKSEPVLNVRLLGFGFVFQQRAVNGNLYHAPFWLIKTE